MCYFGSDTKIVERFTRFNTRKKYANYWLNTQQEQQEDNFKDEICYLKNTCGAEQPFIS